MNVYDDIVIYFMNICQVFELLIRTFAKKYTYIIQKTTMR